MGGPKARYLGFRRLYTKDILLAKKYGIQCIRTSVEWARIEPAEGVWDKQELDRPFRLAKFAAKNHVCTIVNLSHFSLPLWVAKKGGLGSDEFPAWFAAYAEKVAQKFSRSGSNTG